MRKPHRMGMNKPTKYKGSALFRVVEGATLLSVVGPNGCVQSFPVYSGPDGAPSRRSLASMRKKAKAECVRRNKLQQWKYRGFTIIGKPNWFFIKSGNRLFNSLTGARDWVDAKKGLPKKR